ncbi:MAG: hypothetical protein Tsb0027_24400 [Wenzhouxiangellaceae bacterium]
MTKIFFLTKRFILLGLVSSCAVLQAQDVDDEDSISLPFPYPETGAWSQQNDSNTGFFFEIQNGRVAAAYFGFDGQGDDAWVIFAGDLEPLQNDNPDRYGWRLSATLLRFADGGCILDCQNVGDSMASNAQVGQIVIDFTGRSVATFSVDGAESSQIVPMAFGSGGFVEFPEVSDLLLPVLTGVWIADYPIGQIGSLLFDIGERVQTGVGPDKLVSYPVSITAGATGVEDQEQVFADTIIECAVTPPSDEPVCEMSLPPSIFVTALLGGGTNVAVIKLDRVSDSRITLMINHGGSPQPPSRLMSFYRLNYD